MDREALSRKLRDLRVRAGLSQDALGGLLGRPQSFVSKVETQGRRVELAEIEAWSRACGAGVVLQFLDGEARSASSPTLSLDDQALVSAVVRLVPRLTEPERVLLTATMTYLTGRALDREGADA